MHICIPRHPRGARHRSISHSSQSAWTTLHPTRRLHSVAQRSRMHRRIIAQPGHLAGILGLLLGTQGTCSTRRMLLTSLVLLGHTRLLLVARQRVLLMRSSLGGLLGWCVGVLLGEVHPLLGGDGDIAFDVAAEVQMLASRNLEERGH